MLEYINTFNRRFGEYGSALAYTIVFLVTIYDVAMRYFFDAPSIWGLELVIAVAGIHYVMAGAYTLAEDKHVRIDVVYKMFSPRIQRKLDVLASMLAIVFLAIVAYYGSLQAYSSILSGETSGGGWDSHAPMFMKIAIPVGAVLMLLQTIYQLVVALRSLKT